jgi:nitric oxide reductase subunit C
MMVKPKYIFFMLCFAFTTYTLAIYRMQCNAGETGPSHQAGNGRLVWQKYNCQSCHQLYGLGGYLGPDLTNVYSAKGKGELFIKAFLRAGTKQMPSFNLSREEETGLMTFLRSADVSGLADPRTFRINNTGMTEPR